MYKYKEATIENLGTLTIYYDEDAESPREWDNIGTMVCWHRRYRLGDKHSFKEPEDFLRGLASEVVTDKEAILNKASEAGVVIKVSPDDETLYNAYNENGEYWLFRDDDDYETIKEQLVQEAIDSELGLNALQDLIVEAGLILQPLYLYDHGGISISTSSFVGRAHHAEWDSGQVGWIYVKPEKIKYEYGEGADAVEKTVKYIKGEVEEYDNYLRGECFGYVLEYEDGEEDSLWGCLGSEYVEDWLKDNISSDYQPLIEELSYSH